MCGAFGEVQQLNRSEALTLELRALPLGLSRACSHWTSERRLPIERAIVLVSIVIIRPDVGVLVLSPSALRGVTILTIAIPATMPIPIRLPVRRPSRWVSGGCRLGTRGSEWGAPVFCHLGGFRCWRRRRSRALRLDRVIILAKKLTIRERCPIAEYILPGLGSDTTSNIQ